MTRNDKIKTIVFIVAVAVAIFFFTRGVYGITNKEEDFYTITPSVNDEAGAYAKGINFTYYFNGKSNEIKERKMEVEECYSDALLRAYKLTDPSTEYEGFNNLCTLNLNPGKEIQVSQELYLMLKDAYEKTLENKGYSVFAGSYYTHWYSILTLNEPEEFDPLNNSDEAKRLDLLLEKTLEDNAFSLEFKEDNKVVFNLSSDYKKYLEDNEESFFCLDFNLLREAYMVNYTQDMLTNRGYTRGLITTDKGLLVDLGNYEVAGYNTFSVEEGKLNLKDTVKVPAGGKMSGICVIPFSETATGYYSIEKDGKTYYRNPFVALVPGGFTNYIESSYVASVENSIVDVMYTNISVNSTLKGEDSDSMEVTGNAMEIYIVDKQ